MCVCVCVCVGGGGGGGGGESAEGCSLPPSFIQYRNKMVDELKNVLEGETDHLSPNPNLNLINCTYDFRPIVDILLKSVDTFLSNAVNKQTCQKKN